MSDAQIFTVAIAAVALVAAVAVFAVAFRRDGEPRPPALDKAARKRDRSLVTVAATPAAPAAPAEETAAPLLEEDDVAPVPDPLLARPVVTAEEYGISRRKFFNRAIGGVFGVFLLQFALGFLAFFWPRLKAGGFGGKIDAGLVSDIIPLVNLPDGTIAPLFVASAQAYIIPFAGDAAGTPFEGKPVIADGLMAVWQRCVHLGCRVPVCVPSQGFECPCHGSKYNFHGEYQDGPAPRNMDRFGVEVSEAGRLIVDTGTVFQTARSKTKTIKYPQGPSCVG